MPRTPEPITTLTADLAFFDRPATAFATLESFLALAPAAIDSAVLDPLGLQLPDELRAAGELRVPDELPDELRDELRDERGRVQDLIDAVEREPVPKRRFLAVTERAYDVRDPDLRAEYARLSYCSMLATVWGTGRSRVLFEASDGGRSEGRATYWLPDSLKARFFAQLPADGLQVPAEWLQAVPKEQKPWWRRRS